MLKVLYTHLSIGMAEAGMMGQTCSSAGSIGRGGSSLGFPLTFDRFSSTSHQKVRSALEEEEVHAQFFFPGDVLPDSRRDRA